MAETSSSAEAVVRSFVIADSVLEASTLAARLEQYDRAGKQPEFRTALIKLASALDRMTRWFLEHQEEGATMATLAERYSAPLTTLIRDTADILPAGELAGYHRSITSLKEVGFSEEDAKTLTLAQFAGAYLDVAQIANTTHRPLMEAARLFAGLSSELQIPELLRLAQRIDSIDPWDLSALRSLKTEIRSGVGRLLRSLLKEKGDGDAALTQYRSNRSGALERLKTDVKRLEDTPVSVAALFVLSRQLEGLCRAPFAS
jgi:NAD-specific glutamate dehydrogenase